MDNIDDIFDDKKLKKSVRKAKIKTIIKMVIISIIIYMVGSFVNFRVTLKYSEKAYEANEAFVKLSVPNGYISNSNDIMGFLGGSGTYKIAKNIGGKSVILGERISIFGIRPPMNYYRINGGGPNESLSEWPVSLWENGYKKMRFFHPELQYKEYQNDLETINKIPDGKVIEMAISFDRPYKTSDMYLIESKLRPAKIKWLWLDEFSIKLKDEFKYEIENYDAKANGIDEIYTVGIPYLNKYGIDSSQYNQSYDEVVDMLSKSFLSEHKDLYKEIIEKGKTKAEDAEVLGVVVHGTKEELKQLLGNPLIKATSFGVVVDPIY